MGGGKQRKQRKQHVAHRIAPTPTATSTTAAAATTAAPAAMRLSLSCCSMRLFLIDSVLGVVRMEAEGCDCLQEFPTSRAGVCFHSYMAATASQIMQQAHNTNGLARSLHNAVVFRLPTGHRNHCLRGGPALDEVHSVQWKFLEVDVEQSKEAHQCAMRHKLRERDTFCIHS